MNITTHSKPLIAEARKKFVVSNADVSAGENFLEVCLQNADCVDALYGIEFVLINSEKNLGLHKKAVDAFSNYTSDRKNLSDLERYSKMYQRIKAGSYSEAVIGQTIIDTVKHLSKATNATFKNGFVATFPDVIVYKKCLESAQLVFDRNQAGTGYEANAQAYNAAALITEVAPQYVRLSACTKRSACQDVNAGMIALNKLFRSSKAKGDVSEWKSIANDVAEEVAELCLTEKLQKDYAVSIYPLAAKAKAHLDEQKLYVKGFDGAFESIKQKHNELRLEPHRGITNKRRRPRNYAFGA